MATSTESERLRVVGQDLEQRKVSDFEVLVEPEGYRVRGHAAPDAPQPVVSRKWGFGGFFKTKAAATDLDRNPESGEFERSYTWLDIERLDELYRTQRKGVGSPDSYALSQVLRVVGAYVEQRRWVLVGVSRKRHMVEIQHRDAGGQLQTVVQRYSDLYDFSHHMFNARRAQA